MTPSPKNPLNRKGTNAPRWTVRQRVVYSSIGTLAGLLLLEVLLRLAGFRYSIVPLSMEYVQWITSLGHTQQTERGGFKIDFRADPELLWSPLPKEGITNSLGFRGREWNLIKPEGTFRIICLGDSCTIAGKVPYPERLERYMKGKKPACEVYNAGVGSWTTFQGRRLLETRLLKYRPDVVTIYFGWNDHWLAWSHPDDELVRYLEKRSRWINLFNRSRLAQGLTGTAHKLLPSPDPRKRNPTLFRVSLRDYDANLRAMAGFLRNHGSVPVFVTAPTGLHPNHPVVQYLYSTSKLFHDPLQINAVHDAYNSVVRRVAKEEKTPIVDLAQEMLYLPGAQGFFTDGIHLTEDGLDWVARRISETIIAPMKMAGAE